MRSGQDRVVPGTLFASLVLLCAAAGARAAATQWAEESGHRSRELAVAGDGRAGFTLLNPEQTGVYFTNSLSADRSITNHVLLNGSGVAAGDVDGDGQVDLYFCGLDSQNRLYRNLGNWRFENITTSARVACQDLDATGAALADIDGDPDLDLIVNSVGGGTHILVNDGQGRFSPAAKTPVLNQRQAGTSLALADMDGDGALDLYVANYRPMFFFLDKPETRYSVRNIGGEPRVMMIDGRPLTDPEFTNRFVFQVQVGEGRVTLGKEELGQVDTLFRNDGSGAFAPISWTNGAFLDEAGRPLAEPPRDWGLSVMFRDLNGDGFPDLYVCNDFRTPDRVWINDGHGRFHALPQTALRSTCLSSMGLDVADVNRDGCFDIFVADMLATEHTRRLAQRIDLRPEPVLIGSGEHRAQYSRNMLLMSRGDGTFAEMAQLAGLGASDWTWSPVFLDVDLDGLEDLLIANGFERDTMSIDAQRAFEEVARQQRLTGLARLKLRRQYPRLATPNLAFRNLGDGTFDLSSREWGFDTPVISQGMCLADLDGDGDLDLIANNFNAVAGLYRNESPAPRIAVRLKGRAPNTRGIGAKIELFGGPVYQSQEMICGGRYCSSDDPMRTFASGSSTNRLKLIVTWRGGHQSVLDDVKANRLYEISEMAVSDAKEPAPARQSAGWLAAKLAPPERVTSPMFRDVSLALNHSHREEAFNGFEQQPLLPFKHSQLGPGVTWFDLDQDGWDDLIVGAGRGGRLSAFRNARGKSFEALTNAPLKTTALRDQTAMVAWRDASGKAELLIGSASYEDAQSSTPSGALIDWSSQRQQASLPGYGASVGALALADVDSDGDLDLFAAGRIVPHRYPEAASSRVFLRGPNGFELDARNTRVFEKVGLVSGAMFTDLNDDSAPDLVLACHWGPIRVFVNQRGAFLERTKEFGLEAYPGWWNGVTAGDFDGDGRMDIAASNWGRNSPYERCRQNSLRLYYGDFNGDGTVQLLQAYLDPSSKSWVPWRRLDEVSKAMPFVSASFSTFEQFGQADVTAILGDRLPRASLLEASWFNSTVFLNRNAAFEARPLPLEAQLAPAFGVCAADLDGDGAEDLFLGQNFFAVPPEVSRYDAGRGLWLRGDGKGEFEAVSGSESGLLIHGEQRGAAVCDYDADGRVDLVVTQNGAPTRLFQNQGARPGLRVRLKGPPGNPDGIGARLRLITPNGPGPAREIRAGGGYWSQDAFVQVLADVGTPARLEVRWPGGKVTETPLPSGAREIEVDSQAKVRVIQR